IVEHQDVGDVSNFLDRLERMRPDVVLVDISGWKEPLEGLVSSIRSAVGDPMIIALNTSADADAILASMRAGVNEYLYLPLQEPLRKALEKRSVERSRRRDGSAKGSGKSMAYMSAKGGCGATTIVCHVAAELGRLNHRVLLTDLDLDAGMVGFITKTKSMYSILDAVNNLHRLDIHYWKALVSNGIPGVEIISSPLALAAKQSPRDDQVRQVISFARPHYDWTLVDLGRSLSRMAMSGLEEIDEACLAGCGLLFSATDHLRQSGPLAGEQVRQRGSRRLGFIAIQRVPQDELDLRLARCQAQLLGLLRRNQQVDHLDRNRF